MRKFIIANWKLNPPDLRSAKKLASSVLAKTKNKIVVICPPAIFLSSIKFDILGAQDCFWKEEGAYTGQVSPKQLKSLKVEYCIVGHSERRATGDSDSNINAKIKALLEVKITPVLCVGFGTSASQSDSEVIKVLKKQIKSCTYGTDVSKIIVAYEPVWAISSGNPYATKKIATPEHSEKISAFIKTAHNIQKVLYGGSINAGNAKSFLSQKNIDGLLVGGASLNPAEFNKIIATSL